jgi:transaldolase/glucose-6-phosphate isomerase
LGSAPGYPALHVLDSTDLEQVRRFEGSVDIARTLFIVASKSGSTLEPNVLMDYFFARASVAVGSVAATHFVAITDPGSLLQKTAEAKGFRDIFLGIPGIGGRYSVLSKFAWSRWRRPDRTRALSCATRARWRRRAAPATLPIIPVWR